MHPYAVFDHKRQVVGRFLGIVSFVASPILGNAIVGLSELTDLQFIGSFVITSSLIYLALDKLFDHLVWKLEIVGKLLSIPNFSGQWSVKGKTITDSGSIGYEWDAQLNIFQTWNEISIQLTTSQSQSYSYTATASKLPDESWQLSYSYSNQPNLEQEHDLSFHRGFCELVFDLKSGVANGTYFNSHGRRTRGNMELKRDQGK
ncbi:pancortin-3 [Microbulbifer sp. VTAC004]|uniref:Cap15 family cyclic dinucleotide receptor domain-containing protein n=1 Tax=Microbulbifer sp. VTAC004 TaxID=3243386 RepID=UPI00403931D9